jgi:hypothetical protein
LNNDLPQTSKRFAMPYYSNENPGAENSEAAGGCTVIIIHELIVTECPGNSSQELLREGTTMNGQASTRRKA